MFRFVSAFALAATLLLTAGQISVAQTTPAQIVKERQDAMEKNWTEYFRDVARTVRTDSPDLALIATKSAQASRAPEKTGAALSARDRPRRGAEHTGKTGGVDAAGGFRCRHEGLDRRE